MKPKSKETRSTCLEKNLQGHKSSTGRQQRCKREQSRRCSRVRNSPRKRWLLFQAVRHTPPWPCLNLEQHCHCSDSNFPSKCCKLCDTCMTCVTTTTEVSATNLRQQTKIDWVAPTLTNCKWREMKRLSAKANSEIQLIWLTK